MALTRCIAFSHPCNFNIGDELHHPLLTSDSMNVMISRENKYDIKSVEPDSFIHAGIGKIIDRQRRIICIGKIKIILTGIPNDIREGQFVEFRSPRFDILD